MTPWVLIVFITTASTGQTMTTQEFSSKQACEAVRDQLRYDEQMKLMGAYAAGTEDQMPRTKANCVPK